MAFTVLIIIALAGSFLSYWSFKRILKLVIGCVGIAHYYGEKDRRTCTFIQTSRKYLRFYFLMLFAGIALIILSTWHL